MHKKLTHTLLLLSTLLLLATGGLVSAQADGDNDITLNFGEGNFIDGFSGCNRFSGSYTLDGDSIIIGGLLSTLMACGDETVEQQEQIYLEALRSAATYELTANQLTIAYADGQQLTFASVSRDGDELEGSQWQLMSYGDPDAPTMVNVLDAADTTPDTTDGVTLTVEETDAIMTACPDPRDSGSYGTIQGAINCALGGDTIDIAAGTYNETLSIDKAVTLIGDDDGTTLIDAQGAGSVVEITNPVEVTLVRLTLTGGEAPNGGAINTYGGSVIIADSDITGNTATVGGGAISTYEGDIELRNSAVSDNSVTVETVILPPQELPDDADYGGGEPLAPPVRPQTTANGGGIATYSGDITVIDSTISDNLVSLTITSDSDDVDPFQVGGHVDGAGLTTYEGTITIENSELVGNVAEITSAGRAHADGAAISTYEGAITVTDSSIRENRLRVFGADTMLGIEASAAAIVSYSSDIMVDLTEIVDNEIEIGGSAIITVGSVALATYEGAIEVSSSTITGNRALDAAGEPIVRPLAALISTYSGSILLADSEIDGALDTYSGRIVRINVEGEVEVTPEPDEPSERDT